MCSPVLRHTDGRLLKATILLGGKAVLWIYLQPTPMVGALGAYVIDRLTWAEGELLSHLTIDCGLLDITLHIGKHLGICHNKRFALPLEE